MTYLNNDRVKNAVALESLKRLGLNETERERATWGRLAFEVVVTASSQRVQATLEAARAGVQSLAASYGVFPDSELTVVKSERGDGVLVMVSNVLPPQVADDLERGANALADLEQMQQALEDALAVAQAVQEAARKTEAEAEALRKHMGVLSARALDRATEHEVERTKRQAAEYCARRARGALLFWQALAVAACLVVVALVAGGVK